MLYFVLLLVAAALAGVVAALITANSLWAWISIGLSVLAGIVLLVDWFRRRSGGTATAAAEPSEVEAATDAETAEQARVDAGDVDEEPAAEAATEPEAAREAEQEAEAVEAGKHAAAAEEPAAKAVDAVPGEEQTDAADALIVSDLDTEVLVVDEYPRYHLDNCGWLTDRETIPISVAEARQLGFSPCARCEPDAALAAEHRTTREKFGTRADS